MSKSYLKNKVFCPPSLNIPPHPGLGIIVVIPCYNEPELIRSLESLRRCDPPKCRVEVIVVINQSESSQEAIRNINETTFQQAIQWTSNLDSSFINFHFIYKKELPRKKAGVGLARKIGMDEAAYRFELIQNPKGIIVGFDADALVDKNYFQAVENHFSIYPEIQAASIRYEHPLEGEEYETAIYEAIIQYELHLRYFVFAKRYAGYPHAYDTVGSSMAVRSDAYQAQGGMNKKKAGEDFYFLNKFIVLGKLNEINETKVIPSPRISDRVPFGTGKAVGALVEQPGLTSYHFQSFDDLKMLFEKVDSFYSITSIDQIDLPDSVQQFFQEIDAENTLEEIRSNTADFVSFKKRFFRWFDPFLLMKYVHFARDHFYPNIPVKEAGNWVLKNYFQMEEKKSEKEILLELRMNNLKRT